MHEFELEELRQIVEVAMDREVPVLEPGADLYTDVGMDSMGAVAVVVEIQRRHRVRIRESDMPQLRRAEELLVHVQNLLRARVSNTDRPTA